jgi:hypothetical protein
MFNTLKALLRRFTTPVQHTPGHLKCPACEKNRVDLIEKTKK